MGLLLLTNMGQQSWMIGSCASEVFYIDRAAGRTVSPKPPQSLPESPKSLPKSPQSLKVSPKSSQSLPNSPHIFLFCLFLFLFFFVVRCFFIHSPKPPKGSILAHLGSESLPKAFPKPSWLRLGPSWLHPGSILAPSP